MPNKNLTIPDCMPRICVLYSGASGEKPTLQCQTEMDMQPDDDRIAGENNANHSLSNG